MRKRRSFYLRSKICPVQNERKPQDRVIFYLSLSFKKDDVQKISRVVVDHAKWQSTIIREVGERAQYK